MSKDEYTKIEENVNQTIEKFNRTVPALTSNSPRNNSNSKNHNVKMNQPIVNNYTVAPNQVNLLNIQNKYSSRPTPEYNST
jgi:hypothetical protein